MTHENTCQTKDKRNTKALYRARKRNADKKTTQKKEKPINKDQSKQTEQKKLKKNKP